jgi:NitT/TauT family transport system permease protein
VANTARLDANAYLVVAGILKRPPRFSELSWSPYLDAFVSVRLPFALPYVFTGMKVAATLVFMGVIVGEFISADAGLGYFNLNAGARSNTPGMFAGLVALSLLGLAFYGMIVLAERAVQRWWRG